VAHLEDWTDRRIEFLEVAVLALVAIATAWSGFQGSAWGGRQSVLYAQASTERLKAEALSTHAGQVLVADATIFTAWLQAEDAGDAPLMARLERRFSPEYAAAFDEWLALDPFGNPEAPPGPAAMPGFSTAEFDQAQALKDRASVLLDEGTTARDTANQYIRATVLFAAVLFLVAIAQRFKVRGPRVAANLLAIALLLYAVGVIVSLPRV
jgi:hypothetical protein